MKTSIKIENLTKYYGKIKAVDRLSLEVFDKEIFGLLGPNGAGKTTTLLIMATVLKPTSGTIYVEGIDVTKEPDRVRKFIGISFQSPKALHIDKVYEILTWHAKICGLPKGEIEFRVRNVMERLGIWEHRNKLFMQLSGGLKKRVEVAKILIQRPKIAIFDEPTAQIDVIGRHEIWNAIRELRDEGSTVIIATNNMSEAEALCDRIAIIHKGKLVVTGSPEELKDKIPGGDIIEITVDRKINSPKILSEISSKINALSYKYSGNICRFYLSMGEKAIPKIIEILKKYNYEVREVKMKEPTLDDVFFYFTGATLMEEQ